MSIQSRNEEWLFEFITYLDSEKSSDKTKEKHVGNVDFLSMTSCRIE